jgi:transposase InsO family protein
MSRQNFYQKRRHRLREGIDEDLVEELVLKERHLQPRLGARKILHLVKGELREAGVKLGRDRFFAALRFRGLLLEPIRPLWPCTTQSSHYLPVFKNLIKELVVTAPHQVWVVDLTYVRTKEAFLYLALITDKFSRKIIGMDVDDRLGVAGSLRALDEAIKQMPAGVKPIHHSDRGSQYCCHEYVKRAQEASVQMSMTEEDHCAENAMAERVNGILKQEYGLGGNIATKALGRELAMTARFLYNTRRPHCALGMEFPERVHERFVVKAGVSRPG